MAPGACIGRNGPACCAAVENFVAARHRDAHKQKVTRARSLVNNGWSVREETKLAPSRRNVKNDRQQDDRFANIERENMRLLMKMQEIDQRRDAERRREAAQRPHDFLPPQRTEACTEAARIATAARIVLGVPQKLAPTRCIARSASVPSKGRGSNEDARMRELRRIDSENQRMLKRLQTTRPTVSNKSFEDQHQMQQRVMRMRQERGPKMPPSLVPLPFGAQPENDVDVEEERIEGLHAAMQRRLEELEQMEEVAVSDDGALPPATPPSARSEASRSAAEPGDDCETIARPDHIEQREYVGGQMPEHSRLLVEKLMEELEDLENKAAAPMQDQRDTSPPVEEDADDDKDAVARILAAADALDVAPTMAAPHRDYLCYDNVIQRSRATLEAADRQPIRGS